MSVGALSHFGFAEESAAAPGTLVAITKFFDPTSADIDDAFPKEGIPTMRADRVVARSIPKIVSTSGNFKSPLMFNALPFMFKMGFGKCTTTADGTGYKHVFVGEKKLPTFSAEIGYYSGMAKQAAGCKVGKLGFSAKAGEVCEVSGEFLGLSTSKNAPATPVLPSDDNTASFQMATVTFDAVGNLQVQSVDLELDNALEAVNTLNGTFFPTRINEGVRKIGLGMEMDFLDQNTYDLSRLGTKKAVVLLFTSTVLSGGAGKPYTVKFNLPNVKFSGVGAPVEAEGVISQKVECVPMYDTVAGFDLELTVTNTDTSYPNVP